YEVYLQDESRLHARGISSISFPKTTEEVAALLANFTTLSEPVTVSGGRTGLCGGAVPDSDTNLVSLEKLKFIDQPITSDSKITIKVGAGVTLSELQGF